MGQTCNDVLLYIVLVSPRYPALETHFASGYVVPRLCMMESAPLQWVIICEQNARVFNSTLLQPSNADCPSLPADGPAVVCRRAPTPSAAQRTTTCPPPSACTSCCRCAAIRNSSEYTQCTLRRLVGSRTCQPMLQSVPEVLMMDPSTQEVQLLSSAAMNCYAINTWGTWGEGGKGVDDSDGKVNL